MTYSFSTERVDLQTIQTTLTVATEGKSITSFLGEARCRKGDTYSYEIGKLISSLRATEEFLKQLKIEQETLREEALFLNAKITLLNEEQRKSIENIIHCSYQKSHLYTRTIFACDNLIRLIPQLYEEFGNFMDKFNSSL